MEIQRSKTEFSDKLVKIENKERTCSMAQLLQQLMLDYLKSSLTLALP